MADECRPTLAVCAYHRSRDLWTLPALLKAANPEYRVFLRRYAEECWKTVDYAIPPERLAAPDASVSVAPSHRGSSPC